VGTTAPGYQVETEPGGKGRGRDGVSGSVGTRQVRPAGYDPVRRRTRTCKQTTFTLKGAAQEAQQPGAPEVPVGSVGPNWLLIVGVPLAVILLLIVTILSLPPVRRRIKRAWTAFSHSE
jgi:hypothetical protein